MTRYEGKGHVQEGSKNFDFCRGLDTKVSTWKINLCFYVLRIEVEKMKFGCNSLGVNHSKAELTGKFMAYLCLDRL